MIRRTFQIAFVALILAGTTFAPTGYAGSAAAQSDGAQNPTAPSQSTQGDQTGAPEGAAPATTAPAEATDPAPETTKAGDTAPAADGAQTPAPQDGDQATKAPVPAPEPATSENDSQPPEKKAAAPTIDELVQPVASLATAIDAAEKRLERAPSEQKELASFRGKIEAIQFDAKAAAEKLRPRLAEVQSQIAKLGDPPAKNAPPEAPEVAEERAKLNKLASQLDGAIKTADLVEVRARQLIGRVQELRQGIFTRFLLLKFDSPLRPQVWAAFVKSLPEAEQRTAFIAANWWSLAVLHWLALLGVLAAAIALYVVLHIACKGLIRKHLDTPRAVAPPLHVRAATAVWVTIALAAPTVIAATVGYIGLDGINLIYWQVARFAQSVLFCLVVFVTICALTRAVLQPTRATWRVFDLSDHSAATIARAVQSIAAVYVLDFLGRRIIAILSMPPAASIILAFVASLFYIVLIAAIVRTRFVPWTLPPGAPVSRWRPYWLKGLLIALAVALIGTTLQGYASLSRFIAGQALMTGSALLLIALLHIAIKGVQAAPSDKENWLSRISARYLNFEQTGRERFAYALRFALNALMIGITVPLILLGWGVTSGDIASWVRSAIFGFEINGVHISLARIFFALLLFVALVSATRVFQRWLQARAASQSKWDPGLVNSVYTGAGYVGFAVAALAAVAYAGFDITSLAIVAGALSVGIGFGLQSIVNNFVSGIVLLIERPIKVGDWIAIGEGQGYVRRISVRSTEIETFERASLIIPNSEMISQTVTNLTHRNQIGRLNIPVRVSFASDPDVAYRVLEQVAAQNTSILRHPAPIVVLDNLGDQAMEYSLRVYLADINQSLRVQTEIRTAIVKEMRQAGIDIPYFAVQIGHATGPLLAPDHVSVKISAALSSDPDAVLDALRVAGERIAGAGAEPEVAFDNVGENALEFSVSVALGEGEKARAVQTALRSAVVKVFRERGIELAGSLHDVRLRDADGLQPYLTRLAEDRSHHVPDEDAPPSAAGMPKGKPS